MSLKDKIAAYSLKRRLHGRNRNVAVHNFSTAKKIGLIYEADLREEDIVIQSFIDFLKAQGQQVFSIGFLKTRKPDTDFKTSMQKFYYSKKDLNWLGFPHLKQTKDFLSGDYDILIDLTLNNYFSVEYLLARTFAQFKVGISEGYRNNYCDLTIDISKHRNLPYFMAQLKHYLKIINKDEAA